MEEFMGNTGCCGTDGAPGIKPKMKTIRIEARVDDKYKVAVQAGERTLYVDQPLVAGGEDAGASPMEYLFASLAGCIATTGRIIATQQKLDLKGMDIKVEGPLDLNIIYGKSRDGRPGVTGINVDVALDSTMSEMERQRFFAELRSRCPISDTIAAATPITITAV
jgi:putative redox protein